MQVGFVAGFALGYFGLLGYFFGVEREPVGIVEPEVLAEHTEAAASSEPMVVRISSVERTPAPTPTPTPSPSPTPILTPKPTTEPASTPPVPTSTPDVWSPETMEPLFSSYAGQYGVDKNLLERIANCESHFNPGAVNGDYAGLFQFATNTWINYRNEIGEDPNPDLRHDVEESIQTAAYLVSKRGDAPWPACISGR